MKKVWLMAKKTYKKRLRSGTFLMLTFGIPVVMVIAGAIPFLRETAGVEDLAIGYVDQTGRFTGQSQVIAGEESLEMKSFVAEDAARSAFTDGQIDGYIVIPPDYFDGAVVRYYADSEPGARLEEALSVFLRRGQLADVPEWALERLDDPTTNLVFVARNTGERVSQGFGLVMRFLAPAALGLFFGLAVLFSVGQMGIAVVQEKEQRAMEMIVTSMQPWQLVVGKILGMTFLTATQFGIWFLAAAAAILLASMGEADIGMLSIPWRSLSWGLLLTIPGYFLFAVVAAGLGVLAGDRQQAQQLAGMLGLLAMAPLWLVGLLISNPNGPASIALTLFPFTGPIFALVRMSLMDVPVWQLLASLGILVVTLLISIWFVARIFRAAMLMYGQALRPRQIWRALRQS